MNDMVRATIQSLIDELYIKWGCDPAYYIDDTIEGKKAKIDAYIIEWLKAHLDDWGCNNAIYGRKEPYI